MTTLTYREFLRLRASGLKWQAVTFIAALLEAPEGLTRSELEDRLKEAGYTLNPRSLDVTVCQVNAQLPATVRIVTSYAEGKRYQNGRPRKGTRIASYTLSSDWAREYLLRIARGETLELDAPAPSQERAA